MLNIFKLNIFRSNLRFASLFSSLLTALSISGSAYGSIATVPLYLAEDATPNVLFDMSVETPMGGAAYNDQPNDGSCSGHTSDFGGNTGTCYQKTDEYLGYFDPNKCYTYSSGAFRPSSATNSHHECSGKFSGNFMNWASMTAIDEFIMATTGGFRIVDTTSSTVIRRARKQNDDSWFPPKVLTASRNTAPSRVTPWGDATLHIYNTKFGIRFGTSWKGSQRGTYNLRVEVCNSSQGLEANCVTYPNSGSPIYKPQGIIQNSSDKLRFGVMSYTFDDAQNRDGGVLRAQMKYIGQERKNAAGSWEPNPNKEIDAQTGIILNDPDGLAGSGGVNNSGVINYINEFSTPGYKAFDPIGELFYEAIRYFKNIGPTPEYSAGLSNAQKGNFPVITNWQDPIQSQCQNNFIVGINDANPWLDKRLPGTTFTAPTFNGHTLRAADFGQPSNADSSINVTALTNQVGALEGLNGTTQLVGCTINDCDMNAGVEKTIPGLGEVFGTSPGAGKENSYYIAGLAYYANTQDLRSDLDDEQTITTYMIDTQEYNSTPLIGRMNMLWLAGKYGGFEDSNDNGIPDLVSEWDKNGDGEPDNYVLATSPKRLIDGLNAAVNEIFRRSSSASAVSLNSGTISSDSRLYQAKFSSVTWDGHLVSIPINNDGSLGSEEWDAALELPTSRNIATFDGSTGVSFQWSDISATQQIQLGSEDILNYLRGDQDNEVANGGSFRNRNSLLGDIISSSPVFVGKSVFHYADRWGTGASENSHVAFKNSVKNRTPMVYVGANDGMLHGFNASSGEEQFAFIPSSVYQNLASLSDVNYDHRYFVDGSPIIADAFFNSDWHTVLVSGLRGGGQSIFAIDITDPSDFSTEAGVANQVLWEFTDNDAPDNADLGYTFSQPSIVRLHNGEWAAIFGNGYYNMADDDSDGGLSNDSSTGNAVLYIVRLSDGQLIKKIDTGKGAADDPTGAGRANGLSTPAPVDVNDDSIADYVYAGDLFGNLWKFDLTDGSESNWDLAYTNKPLFVACAANPCTSANRQPITTQPQVGYHPAAGGYMIYFGTGKYFEVNDNSPLGQTTQTFYGIWDKSSTSLTSFNRSHLLEQEILAEINVLGFDYRITSDNSINWHTISGIPSSTSGTHLGWYLDLYNTQGGSSNNHGERQVSDAILRNGRIIFSTLVPSQDPCKYGGDGWLMEFDANTGGRLDFTPFDVNQQGDFNEDDYVTISIDGQTVTIPTSGKKSKVGIIPMPGIITDLEGKKEWKFTSGSKQGVIESTLENPGPGASGRQSWLDLP